MLSSDPHRLPTFYDFLIQTLNALRLKRTLFKLKVTFIHINFLVFPILPLNLGSAGFPIPTVELWLKDPRFSHFYSCSSQTIS